MDKNFTYDNIELLNSFLDKELPAEQDAALAAQIAGNALMQEKIDNLMLARQAIQAQGLKEKMAQLHKIYYKPEAAEHAAKVIPIKPVRPMRAVLLRAAAAVIVLMMGYGVYFYTATTAGSVYDRHYTSYQLPVNRAGENRAAGTDSLFMAGNFDAVISNWKQPGEKSRHERFLTAMAFLEKNQPADAIRLLQDLRQENSRSAEKVFEDESDYYLAMALIKNGDIQEAVKLLDLIKNNPQHLFHKKAKKISGLRLKILEMKN
jgi:hypothetical protein